jgi:tungstate transport system permease protein
MTAKGPVRRIFMNIIADNIFRALSLLLHFDAELTSIVVLSLKISLLALAIATCLGVPLGAFIGLKRLPARGFIVSLLNTATGLPPVVVGLVLYMLLSRSGPLGFLGLLYSPAAMVSAQTILALPIVVMLSHAAVVAIDPIIRQAALALGASSAQAAWTVVREARYGIMSGIVAAFGRVMSEVGAILIVGGNISGLTRVMTTAIALETDKGNFELALALGIVLLLISLVINILLHAIQGQGTGSPETWV